MIEQNVEKNKEQVIVREDLNDMVKSINFRTISNKFGERHVVDVTLFNGKVEVLKKKDAKPDGHWEIRTTRFDGSKCLFKIWTYTAIL